MTNRTITARSSTLSGRAGGALYANGTATVDDSTAAGKAAIAYAKRHGWAVSGGIAAAVSLTIATGKHVTDWTVAELKEYLDAHHVTYPASALKPALLALVQDAFETKAQGGAAAQQSGGHTSGTIPPEGAPPVSNPDKPDDAALAALYKTPLSTNDAGGTVGPSISTQPANVSSVVGQTATFSTVATGTPELEYQWERQADGAGPWESIDDAKAASYTTTALVLGDGADRFRVIVSNEYGSTESNPATLTVTAS